jgi:hypothetical protein
MGVYIAKASKVTAAAPTTLKEKLYIGGRAGTIIRIDARNWSSAARTAAGADVLEKIKITDAAGKVVFLDAADRDYATAKVSLIPHVDDTLTGITITPVDATGAALAAGQVNSPGIPVRGPIKVEVLNCGTATDFFEAELYVRV